MLNNPWIKLATVSLAGIVVSFGILWGINQFSGTNINGTMNMGYGYQNGMQYRQNYGMTQDNSMNGMNMNGMNMNGMNGQGSMNMQGGMNMGGMNMQGQGSMNGNMQGGMMMGGMMDDMMKMQGGMGMH